MNKKTIQELEFEIASIKERILKLEADIRCPLELKFSEQAGEFSNRLVQLRLIQIERENLASLQKEMVFRSYVG